MLRNVRIKSIMIFCGLIQKTKTSINVKSIHFIIYESTKTLNDLTWFYILSRVTSRHNIPFYIFMISSNWVKSLIFLVKMKFWIHDIMFALRIHNEHDFHWKKWISLLELVWKSFSLFKWRSRQCGHHHANSTCNNRLAFFCDQI